MKSVIQEASSIAKAVEQGWEKAGKPKEFSLKILEEPLKNFFGFTKRSAKVAIFFEETKQYHQPSTQPRQQRQQQSRYRNDQRRGDRSERQETQQQGQSRQQPREREQREQREPRQQREQRPQVQPQREQRPQQPQPQQREREPQREHEVQQREQREQREPRETREREPRERFQPREQREPREQQPREQREVREQQPQPREQRENREFQHTEDLTPQWTPAMMDYTKAWINETLASMNLSNISFAIEPSDLHLRVIFYDNVVPDPNQEKKLFASFSTLIYEALKKEFKLPLRGHKIVLLHATAYDLQSRR